MFVRHMAIGYVVLAALTVQACAQNITYVDPDARDIDLFETIARPGRTMALRISRGLS